MPVWTHPRFLVQLGDELPTTRINIGSLQTTASPRRDVHPVRVGCDALINYAGKCIITKSSTNWAD